MALIRHNLVSSVIRRAYALTDFNIQNKLEKRYEFRKHIILADESLTKAEKSEAINVLNKDYDYYKLIYNEGQKELVKIAIKSV
jgi:hypothetical protein